MSDFGCLKWFERNGNSKDKKAQAIGFDCCDYQHIADFSFALGDKRETHLFCHACKGHYFKGKSWTLAEWEEWVNSPDEDDCSTWACEVRAIVDMFSIGYHEAVNVQAGTVENYPIITEWLKRRRTREKLWQPRKSKSLI